MWNIWRKINTIAAIWLQNTCRYWYLTLTLSVPLCSSNITVFLLENCDIWGTDNVCGQNISAYFCAKWRLLFIYACPDKLCWTTVKTESVIINSNPIYNEYRRTELNYKPLWFSSHSRVSTPLSVGLESPRRLISPFIYGFDTWITNIIYSNKSINI